MDIGGVGTKVRGWGWGRPEWVAATFLAAIGACVAAVLWWAAPSEDVPLPSRDASPEQVVLAYIRALNARDFATSNEINDIRGQDHGRFSLTVGSIEHVRIEQVTGDGDDAHVLFDADFKGGDGTIGDGLWGYDLSRGSDGHWHIIDAGVY